MKIGVLAVQGAFIEHEKVLSELGAECVELRKAEDLQADFDGLVLPGGKAPCRESSCGIAICLPICSSGLQMACQCWLLVQV